MILFVVKLGTWKFIAGVLLSLSHQLNYLEIWSLGSKIPQGLHSANARKIDR